MQNQPVGFAPTGNDVGSPHPFVSSIAAGCHLLDNTSTAGNDVTTGVTFTPPTTPYCARWEYYWKADAGWKSNPASDNNFKPETWNAGNEPFPGGNNYYTNFGVISVFAISNITQATFAVITLPVIQGANPFSVGQRVMFYGIEGMTQLNGLIGTITAKGGSSGNYTITVNIDTTGFSAYAAGIPITSITQASPAVATLNIGGASNPFQVGDAFSVTGAAGMTQINGLRLVVNSVGGVSGAWTVTLYHDAQGTPQNTTSFGAYTGNGVAHSGGVSSPYLNTDVTRQYQTDAFAAGFFQGPNDANGHSSSFGNQCSMPINPANGWIKRRIEVCVQGLGAVGYFRVYDTPQGGPPTSPYPIDYAGQTDNLTLSPTVRCISMGGYARDRGPTQFRYYTQPHYDVSGPGVTGQCACVFVGDQPTFAACNVLEPQVADSWSDGSIHITAFYQGMLQSGTTGYIYVCTESSAPGTAVIPSTPSFIIGSTSTPSIATTSLPGATHGASYSASVSATGGLAPYTYSLPTVLPNTGSWLSINSSSGALSGTPGTAETETVYVSVIDSNGFTSWKKLSLVVS